MLIFFSCKKADAIPQFLRFWIPNKNGLNENSVHDFQLKLLSQELAKARSHKEDV